MNQHSDNLLTVLGMLAVLLIIILLIRWINKQLCPANYISNQVGLSGKLIPPGSFGLPFLGESLQFIASYRSHDYPDSFIKDRRSRYGRIFTTHLFGKPTVLSVDAEVNRFILNSDGRLFVPDYPTSLKELWGKWAILMLEGSLHKRVHGLVAALLKSQDLKDHLLHHIEAFISHSMQTWSNKAKVYVEEEVKKISFNVTVKVLLGLNPGPTTQALRVEFHKFIAGVASVPIKLPGTTFYKSLQSRARMVEMIKDVISERKLSHNCNENEDANVGSKAQDILGVLLDESNARGDQYPLEFITDNIVSFLFPAEDSVAMLMTLAVKYISECPEALQQLRKENVDLIESNKGEKLTWRHYLLQLPFTHNVLSETLRLGNIVKGVIRKALVDVPIKDFVIPKGWAVFPLFRGVHLDEDIYPDAHKFNPWRWKEKVALWHFTPFGGGPRYCAGIDIAHLEAVVFLHHLVTKYKWEMAERDTVTNFPFVKLARRLPIIVEALD